MKFKKHLLSVLLVLLLLALTVPVSVSAALPSYNAVEEFSAEKQGSVWRYQIGYNDGKGLYTFSDLEANEGGGYGSMNVGTINISTDDRVTGKSSISMHSGAKSDPVLTFVAPYSGTIEVSMTNGGVYCPLNGAEVSNFDGINFYMCAGSTKAASFEAVSAKNSASGSRVFDKVYTIDIVKGECIYFIVQPNKNTANDSTYISPQVDYIKLSDKPAKTATVPAYIGTRSTSGPNSAVSADITSNVPGTEADGVYKLTEDFGEYMDYWACYYVSGKKFTEMDYMNGAWRGKSPATTATIGGGGAKWHPYISGYTVAMFTAPESGRVQVGSECTMEVVNSTTDGVTIMVVSDNNILGDTYLLNAENPKQDFAVVEFDVYEGQEIFFYLNMNIQNAGDSTTFAPFIKYIDYKDVPKPPKQEEEIYIEPRLDGTLKTDIEPIGTEKEKGALKFDVMQMVIGAAVVLLLAAVVVVVCIILNKKKGR